MRKRNKGVVPTKRRKKSAIENTRIVNKLKEYRNRCYVSGRDELPKDIGDLVYTDPFAFLVGAVFDRGMDWKKA